jgi:hypothetical protein
MRKYYWEWFDFAVRKSWGMAEAIGGVLGVVVPPLLKVFSLDSSWQELLLTAVFGCCGGLAIVRLGLAPWLMYLKEEEKHRAEIATLRAEVDKAKAAMDAAEGDRVSRQEIQEGLTAFRTLKFDLEAIITDNMKERPTTGRGYEMPNRVMVFNTSMAHRYFTWLQRAEPEATKVRLPGYLRSKDQFNVTIEDKAAFSTAFQDYMKRELDAVNEIIETLRSKS